MIKFYCDVCGERIREHDNAYYFKMWDLGYARDALKVDQLPYNHAYLLCPECLAKLNACAQKMEREQ